MEVNEANLQALALRLTETFSPDVNVRKPAEKYLESIETNQNYPVLLMTLISTPNVDATVRQAGAITLKNYIRRNWKQVEDEADRIHPQDRETIKQSIVNLMLSSPEGIQRQLSDAISVIGREDFPAKWPNLLPELVQKLEESRTKTGDFNVINGILATAHSLFKRYRHEFKSNELWTEIKLVLDFFAQPLQELSTALMGLAKQHESDKNAVKVIYGSLLMIMKIFYSLNSQDLPEFFEDNMAVWMQAFQALLQSDVPILHTTDDEPGLLEQIKSQICENIGMYAQKYTEEFTPYLGEFVKSVWNLLVTTSAESKYDQLVSNAIKFIATVAEKDNEKKIFESKETLGMICQNVIIPSMQFRDADEELFEDNPEEYIRKDIEGSDLDTRRRAACDLIRSLSKHFEGEMTTAFGQYVQTMLAKFAENPKDNWKNKDVAIYLVTSLSAKGQTQKQGITRTNELVNVNEFYEAHILPHLSHENVSELPVLKADAIKYLMMFRNQLPALVVKQSFPMLIRFLKSEFPVVHTYAACAIEKLLLVRQSDNTAMVRSEDLATVAETLLTNLFGVLLLPASRENEYVMRAIMRSISTLQAAIIPYTSVLLTQLTGILAAVAKNPSKPHFNHCLFESMSLVIRNVCRSNAAAVPEFEKALFPIFQQILQHDVAEFVPYVFQIFSLTLDFNPSGVSEHYMGLFPCLLTPVLWEKAGNVHPLVRLLRSYLAKGSQQVYATGKLSGILGIFQKLIASKSQDHEGFLLMQAVVQHMPAEAIAQTMPDVFRLLFQRLQSSKTTKFVKCLITFFCFYIIKYSATSFIQLINGIQANMISMIIDRIVIPDVQKIAEKRDKRICAVGITRLLCEAPELFPGQYVNYWAPLLQALVGLFELPEEASAEQDEHFAEVDESSGYQVAYSQLVFAGKDDTDPLEGTVADPKLYLAQSLYSLSKNHPGKVAPAIMNIAPGAQEFLAKYLAAANVQLA